MPLPLVSISRPVLAACAAGAIFGVVYTLSPLTVWFAAAMVPLFAWAGRGLGPRERRWVFGVLGTAVVLRLVALVVFFFATRQVDGSFPALIPDEAYMAYRARMLRYIALDVPLARADYLEAAQPYGESGLHYVHAYIQLLVGESPHTLRLLHTALYLTGSVALFRVVRPAFGPVAALGGLTAVLFVPSLFLWSISYLKDAPHQYLTMISVAAAVAAARSRSIAFHVLAWSLVIGSMFLVRSVRPGGELIVGGGIAIGMLGAALLRRPSVAAIALVVSALGAGVALRNPNIQQRTANLLAQAAGYHAGYVHTAGWNYKLLDPGFYARLGDGTPISIDPNRFTAASTARYVIRATVTFFIFPLPWNSESRSMLAYLPEQFVWNLLVLLALVGTIGGYRRDATLTLMLAATIVLGAVIIGMTSGNYGTLIRHRAAVAILIPWLSGVGVCDVLGWMARWRFGAEQRRRDVPHDEGMHAAY